MAGVTIRRAVVCEYGRCTRACSGFMITARDVVSSLGICRTGWAGAYSGGRIAWGGRAPPTYPSSVRTGRRARCGDRGERHTPNASPAAARSEPRGRTPGHPPQASRPHGRPPDRREPVDPGRRGTPCHGGTSAPRAGVHCAQARASRRSPLGTAGTIGGRTRQVSAVRFRCREGKTRIVSVPCVPSAMARARSESLRLWARAYARKMPNASSMDICHRSARMPLTCSLQVLEVTREAVRGPEDLRPSWCVARADRDPVPSEQFSRIRRHVGPLLGLKQPHDLRHPIADHAAPLDG